MYVGVHVCLCVYLCVWFILRNWLMPSVKNNAMPKVFPISQQAGNSHKTMFYALSLERIPSSRNHNSSTWWGIYIFQALIFSTQSLISVKHIFKKNTFPATSRPPSGHHNPARLTPKISHHAGYHFIPCRWLLVKLRCGHSISLWNTNNSPHLYPVLILFIWLLAFLSCKK